MNIHLYYYIILIANIIFLGGITNILFTRNAIIWLLSIELLYISSFLTFIVYSLYYYNLEGFIYSLFILIIAAVESALGLALIALFFHKTKKFDLYNDN